MAARSFLLSTQSADEKSLLGAIIIPRPCICTARPGHGTYAYKNNWCISPCVVGDKCSSLADHMDDWGLHVHANEETARGCCSNESTLLIIAIIK